MTQQVHILNGDALKERFPKEINGNIIVMRECLIEGDVSSKTYKEFIAKRAKHIGKTYEVSEEEYFEKVASEFEKLKQLPENVDINLWFEDDLFCQANLWFLISQLQQHQQLFLVRPQTLTKYGFGGLSSDDLVAIYKERIPITKVEEITTLWKNYSEGNIDKLNRQSLIFINEYPFISNAIKAHLYRQPDDNGLAKPERTILQIIEDLNTTDFGAVFQEFQEREPIYGFGDLQLKRLYDKVVTKL